MKKRKRRRAIHGITITRFRVCHPRHRPFWYGKQPEVEYQEPRRVTDWLFVGWAVAMVSWLVRLAIRVVWP